MCCKFKIVFLMTLLGLLFSNCKVDTKIQPLVVEDPVITPESGDYSSVQQLSISCSTEGASIRYTVNGDTPDESEGILYNEPFQVSEDSVVKAVAYLSNWTSSNIVIENYFIDQTATTVATPEISPESGTYTSAINVSISCSTPSSSIRYTLDGNTPTDTNGIVYNGPFSVTTNATVKAIAYCTGWTNSSVSTAEYIITETVALPNITPAAGTYSSAQTVTITCSTPGSAIRYTTDNSTPTESYGTVYYGAFTVTADTTVKAMAYAPGWTNSPVRTAEYIITGTVATPNISPAAGTYSSAQTVTITCSTPGSAIRYTTDNSSPTENYGTVYSGEFTVSADTTVKAMAYAPGWPNSPVRTAEYIITGTVATPNISPAAGTYSSAQTVTITCSTPGSAIRYTTDNSTPTESHGTLYSGVFTVSADTTVRAIAYLTGWSTSNEASSVYTITGTVSDPVISPSGGVYDSAQTVNINCTTPGAVIRYTTNGTLPSELTGTVYTAPFTVSADCTVQAIAYLTGWDTSNVTSSAYSFDYSDQEAPEPSGGGNLSGLSKSDTSIEFSWYPAEDDKSEQGDLEYKIMFSTNDNISSLDDFELDTDGREVVADWSTFNDTSLTVTGRPYGVDWFINVAVRDESGKASVYKPLCARAYIGTGDFNADSVFNIVDALLVAQYSVGIPLSGMTIEEGNVNGDYGIDIMDALMITQYYVGLLPNLGIHRPVIQPVPANEYTGTCEFNLPAQAVQDSTFTTSISVDTGNQRLAAYQIEVLYDPAYLSLEEVTRGADGFLIASNDEAGIIRINGFDLNDKGPSSALELLNITWNADAAGETEIRCRVVQMADDDRFRIGYDKGEETAGTVEIQ